jgi:tetratricopeptide (TPR) repeat protein
MKDNGFTRYTQLVKLLRALPLLSLYVFSTQAIAGRYIAPKPTEPYAMIQSAGHEAFENNEFGKSERLLKDAVDRATVFGPDDIRLANSAGELGRLLTVRGRFSEAQPYLEEELYVKQRVIGNAKGQLIPSMASMVKFYLNHGTANKAEALTEDILNFVSGKLKMAGSQGEGAVKYKKGQTLQAWAGEAAPVMITPLLDWAIACDDIGTVYTAHGGYAQAEKLYKAALDVKATILGKQHLSLANSYDNLGTICMMRHENADAESYLRDALQITEKIQPSTGAIYSRLDKLAKCLISEGKLDEAEALYVRAQNFWNSEMSNNGGADARAAYALGSLYCDEKKFDSAAPVLEKAFHMALRNSGADSVQLVPYLQKLAYALYYTGQRGESDQLKARAYNIQPPQVVVKEMVPSAKMQLGEWSTTSQVAPTSEPTATAAMPVPGQQ